MHKACLSFHLEERRTGIRDAGSCRCLGVLRVEQDLKGWGAGAVVPPSLLGRGDPSLRLRPCIPGGGDPGREQDLHHQGSGLGMVPG